MENINWQKNKENPLDTQKIEIEFQLKTLEKMRSIDLQIKSIVYTLNNLKEENIGQQKSTPEIDKLEEERLNLERSFELLKIDRGGLTNLEAIDKEIERLRGLL